MADDFLCLRCGDTQGIQYILSAGVTLNSSSVTSTILAYHAEGFIRPFSSNSCQAFASEDWLGMVNVRIH